MILEQIKNYDMLSVIKRWKSVLALYIKIHQSKDWQCVAALVAPRHVANCCCNLQHDECSRKKLCDVHQPLQILINEMEDILSKMSE